jgi:hypothetical protein
VRRRWQVPAQRPQRGWIVRLFVAAAMPLGVMVGVGAVAPTAAFADCTDWTRVTDPAFGYNNQVRQDPSIDAWLEMEQCSSSQYIRVGVYNTYATRKIDFAVGLKGDNGKGSIFQVGGAWHPSITAGTY